MAVDAGQAAGFVTATSTGSIGTAFGSGSLLFRATTVRVVNSSNSIGWCYVDLTGSTAVASTSASYPLGPGEAVQVSAVRAENIGGFTGFAALNVSTSGSGASATLHWGAWAI